MTIEQEYSGAVALEDDVKIGDNFATVTTKLSKDKPINNETKSIIR